LNFLHWNVHIGHQLFWDIWLFLRRDNSLFHRMVAMWSALSWDIEWKWSDCLEINKKNPFKSMWSKDTHENFAQFRGGDVKTSPQFKFRPWEKSISPKITLAVEENRTMMVPTRNRI
jgi:hypothetical protein